LPPPSDSLWPAVTIDSDIGDVGVIALLSRTDFRRARGIMVDLLRWKDFEDFVCERDGQFLALSSAGVPSLQQRVPLTAFNRWARLTGRDCTLSALDDFAAMWRARRTHPNCFVRGALVPGDAPGFHPASKSGALVIPIAQDIYTRWDRCVASLKLFRNPNSVDRYAALIAEICLARRSSRRGK